MALNNDQRVMRHRSPRLINNMVKRIRAIGSIPVTPKVEASLRKLLNEIHKVLSH